MLYTKSKAKSIVADKNRINTVVSDTMNKMAEIVGRTLGPGGRPVLIERDGQFPLLTKDGQTVAKSLGVAGSEENIIVEAAKEICLNTSKEAGDGTTTAIVLANAIVKSGQNFIKANPKYNPQRVINDLNKLYTDVIVPTIKKQAISVNDEKSLINVATISANGDRAIADAVVAAVMAAGEDGTVLLEESQGNEMKVETIDGYVITSGLKELGNIGRIFINDRANQQCKMDNGTVFLYDGSINDLQVLGYVQTAVENTDLYGKPMIIVAHDYADTVMETIAKNVKGGITICPIKTHRSGVPNSRSEFLRDMAAYTGARVFDPGDIARIDESDFGTFTTARCNTYETFIICEPDADLLNKRVDEIKTMSEQCHSDFDKMFYKAAIGKLMGGISTIWIGGASDLEIREKKARVEDAVEAVRSAIAEGIVPGGCYIHRKILKVIQEHPDRKPSWQIMEEALEVPFKTLLDNCGENYEEIMPMLDEDTIFDANEHRAVNAMDAGIIEPAKVARVSIGNAMSVAGLMTTLGGLVVAPRDANLEAQLEMSKSAFKDMMASAERQQEQ